MHWSADILIFHAFWNYVAAQKYAIVLQRKPYEVSPTKKLVENSVEIELLWNLFIINPCVIRSLHLLATGDFSPKIQFSTRWFKGIEILKDSIPKLGPGHKLGTSSNYTGVKYSINTERIQSANDFISVTRIAVILASSLSGMKLNAINATEKPCAIRWSAIPANLKELFSKIQSRVEVYSPFPSSTKNSFLGVKQ